LVAADLRRREQRRPGPRLRGSWSRAGVSRLVRVAVSGGPRPVSGWPRGGGDGGVDGGGEEADTCGPAPEIFA
jgi:hypothetical protein